METSKAELLDDAVAAVDRLILLAQDCGLPDSAQFLAMAKTLLPSGLITPRPGQT